MSVPKPKTRTCHDVLNDFETYLWKKIEYVAERHKKPVCDDAVLMAIMAYLFDVRIIFKEMAFLDEDLSREDIRKYYDIACLDKNKIWSEDIQNVEKDLVPLWNEFCRIADRNEEEKKKNG